MIEYMTNLAQVKTYGKVGDNSKDTDIETFIPVVEDSVLAITNNTWNVYTECDYTSGSDELTVKRIRVFTGTRNVVGGKQLYSPNSELEVSEVFRAGNVVRGGDIVARSEIVSIAGSVITIDNNVTASGTDASVYINVSPAGLKTIMAQMVLYNTDSFDGDYQVDLESETVGTYSYSMGNEAVGSSGYPLKFENALRPYGRPAFA